MNELVTWRLPFDEVGWNSEVERKIKAGERPALHPETLPKYAKLLCDCWAQDPNTRPNFKNAVTVLSMIQQALV
jgi:hypothetical protein